MSDKKLTISIATVADTAGADAAARSVDKVVDATNRLSRESGEQAARSMEFMAEKAHVSQFAYYDLDEEIKKTNTTIGSFTAGQTQVKQSSTNAAQALYVFSQGFEDAQYGIRGVLNNIPQLVFSMGGTAGLAGAVSLAAVAFSQLLPYLTETNNKSKDLKDHIDGVTQSMGEIEKLRFEDAGLAIDALKERADALDQGFKNTTAAQQGFATSTLDNAAKIEQAQRNIDSVLGNQVEHYKELQALAAAEEEKRKLAAQQAIEAENRKREAAQEAVKKAADYYQQQDQRAQIEQSNLVALRAQLQTIRDQKKELEELVKLGKQANASAVMSGEIGGTAKEIIAIEKGQQAAKKLDDPAFKTLLEGTQNKVDELEQAILSLTKDGGVVQKAENAFLAAQTQLTDITSATAINIEKIQETLAADNLVARSEVLKKVTEDRTKELNKAVSQIETTNEASEKAKQAILDITADGKVTAEESAQLAQSTSQLIGQIQAHQATAGANTRAVEELLRAMLQEQVRSGREIQSLQMQLNQIRANTR